MNPSDSNDLSFSATFRTNVMRLCRPEEQNLGVSLRWVRLSLKVYKTHKLDFTTVGSDRSCSTLSHEVNSRNSVFVLSPGNVSFSQESSQVQVFLLLPHSDESELCVSLQSEHSFNSASCFLSYLLHHSQTGFQFSLFEFWVFSSTRRWRGRKRRFVFMIKDRNLCVCVLDR